MKAQKPSKMTKLDGVRAEPFLIYKEHFYYYNCEFCTRPLVNVLSGEYSIHFILQVGGSILIRSLDVHPKKHTMSHSRYHRHQCLNIDIYVPTCTCLFLVVLNDRH